MPARVLRLYPPAKINLGLCVRGKRADGYHEVRTVLQKLDLRDRVTLTRRPRGLRVWCSHPDVPDGASNLAHRAVRRLLEETRSAAGCSVYIEKKIPAAAGLGGGSADAAAVLFGLNSLWGLGLSTEVLSAMARDLGADVPFFLGGPCALGEGRGDRLTEISPGPVRPVVLVKPPLSVSTARVYGALNSGLTLPVGKPKMRYRNPAFPRIPPGWDAGRNDLEGPVFKAHPIVGVWKRRLEDMGAELALMSGSGPTVFGWFRDVRRAEQVARSIAGEGLYSRLTRTLGVEDRMF